MTLSIYSITGSMSNPGEDGDAYKTPPGVFVPCFSIIDTQAFF